MTDIAAVVLAAGSSRRFGDDNKLLASLDGKPMLTHVLGRVAPLPLSKKIVVVKPGDAEVISLINTGTFDIVENTKASDGMGSSIAAGILASEDADGAIVILGDMPFIKRSTYRDLLAAFQNYADKSIFAPQCEGRRGHPVLFRRRHFADLLALTDDAGAKHILDEDERTVLAVPTIDAGVLSDIDAGKVPATAGTLYDHKQRRVAVSPA